MPQLCIATNNSHKIREITYALKDVSSFFGELVNLFSNDNPEESGDTYEDNAIIKAKHGLLVSGLPSVADDSGLEVFCLGNRPGVHSARYAPTPTERIDRILRSLPVCDCGHCDRVAKFVCVIAFAHPQLGTITFRHEILGIIDHAPIGSNGLGSNGFGFDPIFIPYEPHGEHRTMAQLSLDEKNRISHRGGAVRKFVSWLCESPWAREYLLETK